MALPEQGAPAAVDAGRLHVMQRLRFVDSHTEGEPTRVVVDHEAARDRATAAGLREWLRDEGADLRNSVVLEPRGHDGLVGALIGESALSGVVAKVVFFNNVGVLHGCLHGTMGVAATLRHLGRIGAGEHRLETPVGVVRFTIDDSGLVGVENVPAYRHAAGIRVTTAAHGDVVGDVAWGGNWFFLCDAGSLRLDLEAVDRLTAYARDIRESLARAGITGRDGGEIDHVEIFGPPRGEGASSRNFVLCPGGAYDRSPCGTGTSAKLACLAARGELAEGETWVQESIIGSRFSGSYRRGEAGVVPRIEGRAWITGEGELLFHPRDPYRQGIPS